MIVAIDASSPVPVYEQLRAQLRRMIAGGQVAAGARLPAIRQLARDLGVASATVNRAYELLAKDGWIVGAGRHGTIVVGQPQHAGVRAELTGDAELLAVAAAQAGYSESQLVALVTAAFRRAQAGDAGVL